MNRLLTFRIIAATIFFTFISCSKDNDDPTPSETTITISTADFSKTMDENPVNGQVIGVVSGTTSEGSVTFSIIEQNPAGSFSIDANSGELKVADETLFDYETNPTITGTVKVANGAISENAVVTITLNDLVEENVYEGDLWIVFQDDIDYIGSQGYTHISGFLRIGNSGQDSDIYDLSSLASIKSVGTNLEIKNLDLLPNLNGLENINFVGGDLYLFFNPLVINIEALSGITNIPGDLKIYGNEQLSDYRGLQNISTVGGDLILYGFLHKDFIGFSGITTIGRDLIIQNTILMETIDLNNVTSIGRDLDVSLHENLVNLDFFSNLTTIEGNLKIRYNHNLINFCGLQPVLSSNNLGGTYTADNNAYNPTKQDIIDGNCSL